MTTGTYVCPNCDSNEFTQKVEQVETVTADENGEPETFTATHLDVHFIKCGACETMIEDYR